jgi:hypothetical protein
VGVRYMGYVGFPAVCRARLEEAEVLGIVGRLDSNFWNAQTNPFLLKTSRFIFGGSHALNRYSIRPEIAVTRG